MVLSEPADVGVERKGELGISLIEALIAVGLLFIIAAGILPLFTRAMTNNALGNDATRMATFARETAEETMFAPFWAPDLTLPGANTEDIRLEDWYPDQLDGGAELPTTQGRWFPQATPPAGRLFPALWTRTTRLQQFHSSHLEMRQRLDPPGGASQLPGTYPTHAVNIKMIDVTLDRNFDSATVGTMRPTTIRLLKTVG